MGQFFFFILFIITVLVGSYAYFTPSEKLIHPLSMMIEKSGFNPHEAISNNSNQQLNMTTSRGILQVLKRIDDLAEKQKTLTDVFDDEQQALENTQKEMDSIMKEGSGKTAKDLLRLKELGLEMQDEKRLLIVHGRELIALNDQINKSRQWIAEQNGLAGLNTQSTLAVQQQQDASLNDQAAVLLNKVAQEDTDTMQHTRDMIDKEHQKSQDQELSGQQTVADEMQRLQDQENR